MTDPFRCDRCGFESEYRCHLLRHLSRKVPCRPVYSDIAIGDIASSLSKTVAYTCSKCHKDFSHIKSGRRHENRCTFAETPASIVNNDDHSTNVTNETTVNHTNSHNTTSTNCHNTTTSHKVVNNIQNQVINIHAFGKEDLSFMHNHPNFKRFMIKCLKGYIDGLLEYIRKKHLNPNHLENNNVRKLNKKDPFMDYFNGTEWSVSLYERVLEMILEKVETDFRTFTEANKMDKQIKAAANQFIESLGQYLDWNIGDLSNDDDDHKDTSIDDEECGKNDAKLNKRIKDAVNKLVCEHVYRFSKEKTTTSQ